MPEDLVDIYVYRRAPFEACEYRGEPHNANEGCTCKYVNRPCYGRRILATGQCDVCSACPSCATFYRNRENEPVIYKVSNVSAESLATILRPIIGGESDAKT